MTQQAGQPLSESQLMRLSPRALTSLVVFAALLRWAAYSGCFGSDEVTYTGAAFALLSGDWSVSSYVGANRYGVNLPVAAFGWLFGRTELAAAAYSMLCSVAEVALVAWFGAQMFGARTGLLAGVVLATLPMHVHFAGRLLADSPLALAVTASFVFFWLGEVRKQPWSFLIAGLAAGWSFWIKPATIFYLGVFLVYPLLFRRFDLRWAWMVVGFAAMIVANGVFFHALTDRFWFVFQNMAERKASGYMEAEIAAGRVIDAPGFYLTYLFGKVYHTWLLGLLAAAAVGHWLYRRRRREPVDAGMPFVIWWGGGLLIILSALVVSVSPLMLVPKQVNYMLMFAAPLALLAGRALASTDGSRHVTLVTIAVVPAIALSFLLQASVTVFTANSKATIRYALDRPDVTIYANTNGYRVASFHRLLESTVSVPDIRLMERWNKPDSDGKAPGAERFAVVDTETLLWGTGEPFVRLQDRPKCWIARGTLEPVVEGVGPKLAGLLASVASVLPGGDSIAERLKRLSKPMPALVFEIPETGC